MSGKVQRLKPDILSNSMQLYYISTKHSARMEIAEVSDNVFPNKGTQTFILLFIHLYNTS